MIEPIRLLYVPDGTAIADREVRSLADDRFAVTWVDDPSTLPTTLESDPVDCVLAGLDDPDDAWRDALDAVSDLDLDVPVVLYTGDASADALREAFAAGVADVVHLSVDADRAPLVAARLRSAVEGVGGPGALDLYRTTFEAARDGIAVLDAGGTFLLANPSFATYLGLTPEEVVGENYRESPVVSDAIVEHPSNLLELYAGAYEEALATGRSEFRYEGVLGVDGQPYTVNNRVTAVERDDGSIVYVLVSRDITDRKEQERELARTNERLEEFASVVSHDLRNPLNVAQGYLAEARRQRDSENLERVADAHDRMLELIEDLLTLAREGEAIDDRQPVSLEEVCERAWVQVGTDAADLEVRSDATVRADPGRLRQLLENLFRNAVEHGAQSPGSSSDAGEVNEPDGTGPRVTVDDTEDGFLVEDDGPGIPPDDRETVFETGYSTADGGSGLGLSIVRQIADGHGWTVSVRESSDGGARFVFAGVETGDSPTTEKDDA